MSDMGGQPGRRRGLLVIELGQSIIRRCLAAEWFYIGKPQLDARGQVACAGLIRADPAPVPMIESLAARGQLFL